MDNIGLFDRSAALPDGSRLEESDATSWVAFFCLNMLTIAMELARSRPGVGRGGDQVPRALPGDRARDAPVRLAAASRCGTTTTASSTTCSCTRTARRSRCGCARWSGCCRCWRSRTHRSGRPDALPDFTARLRWLQRRRPDLLDGLMSHGGAADEPADHCSRCSIPTGCAGCWPGCSTRRSSFRRTASARCRRPTATPYTTADRGAAAVDRLRARRVAHGLVRRQLELARTGLVPGERAARRRAADLSPASSATTSRSRCRPGRGSRLTLAAAADLIDSRLCDLFRLGADGRRPCDGARIEASDDPLWREH